MTFIYMSIVYIETRKQKKATHNKHREKGTTPKTKRISILFCTNTTTNIYKDKQTSKMKALSKPLSSPGRPDKFPPPLMRFLRSNVGSRSRGRSRSSPLFYLRSKKRVPGVIETTQEPSSPKVTCIGQVRVRRSSKSKSKKTGTAALKKRRRRRRRCWWLKKTLFCRGPKRPFSKLFCKWGCFFRCGYCKKVDNTEDSFRDSNRRSEKIENRVSVDNRISSSDNSRISDCSNKFEKTFGGGGREIGTGFLESSTSPPKNALMLTRCRSAPYRSSSLAVRFWGSPLAEKGEDSIGEETEELQRPVSENVEEEPRISEENAGKELEDNNCVKNVQDLKVHPLLLTRCKSEPAKTGERLMPRRLDDVELRNS